jgi:hypothetical protein
LYAPNLRAGCLMFYIVACVMHVEIFEMNYCMSEMILLYRGVGYPVLTTVLLLILWICHRDPGRVRPQHVGGGMQPNTFCEVCNIDIDISSKQKVHHCKSCGHCVEGFDHHCGILGVCIGKLNHTHFTNILILGAIGHAVLCGISLCRPPAMVKNYTIIWEALVSNNYWIAFVVSVEELFTHLAAYVYFWMAFTLCMFGALHILLTVSDSTTLELMRLFNSNTRKCSTAMDCFFNAVSVCFRGGCAGCVRWLHAVTDPCFCLAGVVSPELRWKCLCVIPLPFAWYSATQMMHALDVMGGWGSFAVLAGAAVSCVWHAATLLCMYRCALCMREVVLSHNHHDSSSTMLHSVNETKKLSRLIGEEVKEEELLSVECDNSALQSIAPRDTEEGLVTEPSRRDPYSRCDRCERDWCLADHHCNMLGTCIHKRNRRSHTRCLLHCLLSLLMYSPVAYRALQRHWSCPSFGTMLSVLLRYWFTSPVFSPVAAVTTTTISTCLRHSAWDLVVAYFVLGSAAVTALFYVQQVIYSTLASDVVATLRPQESLSGGAIPGGGMCHREVTKRVLSPVTVKRIAWVSC